MKSNTTLQFSLIVLLGLTLVSASLATLALAGRTGTVADPACGCSLVSGFSRPAWLRPAAIAAGGLLLWMAFVTGRTLLKTHRFLRSRLASRRTISPARLGILTSARIDLLPNSQESFCYGFWKPRIALGERLTTLKPAELQSVVSHESAHAGRRDPLKLLIVSIVSGSLGRWLGGPALLHQFTTSLELDADEAAVEAHGRLALARAFLRLLVPSQPAAVAVPRLTVTESRILGLLGEQRRPRLWLLGLGVLGLLLGSILGLRLTAQAAASPPPTGGGGMCQRPTFCPVPIWEQQECFVSPAGQWCVHFSTLELISRRR